MKWCVTQLVVVSLLAPSMASAQIFRCISAKEGLHK